MTQWKPIETAPRVPDGAAAGTNGQYVLLANENGTWVGSHCPRYVSGFRPENEWQCMMLNVRHMGRYVSLEPTHWMPLPEPPK